MSEMPPPSAPPPGGGSYTPPPAPPGGSSPSPGSDRTLMVVLGYLWILALVPLLTKKDDSEVQWHAKNGLSLLGAEIVCWIAFMILGRFMPIIGCGIWVVQCVVWLGFLALRVLCIMKGVNGQRFRIPVISDFADKL